MSALSLKTGLQLQQRLSPRLQQAVRLLQLSSLDFAQEMDQVLDRNPFLESSEDGCAETQPGAPQGEHDAGAKDSRSADDSAREAFEAAPAEHETWLAYLPLRDGRSEAADNPVELHPQAASLCEHLLDQLRLLHLSARDLTIACAIAASLDEDGYLRCSPPDIAAASGLSPAPADEEIRIALRRVQSLEPLGVGARSLRECLLLQLDEIAERRLRAVARAILAEHFDLLAARDMEALARATAQPAQTVRRAVECIRGLDPHPGWRVATSRTEYVLPDVVVRKVRGAWSVSLNPAIVPKVRINEAYVELFRHHRRAEHAPMAEQLREARWTLNHIEQRFATILDVSQAIIDRQQGFFEHGPLAMKPLVLREIAEELSLHESTVSRVVSNKYMATPVGVFEFRHFFSRALAGTGGGECSTTAVRGLIADMIAAENPQAPLSDAELTRRLVRRGIRVARRTVTKYRQTMRIASVAERCRNAACRAG